jgi:acetylornithine deacetylase/succinyl-diaminopimelate desuccinylase-like protein
MIGVYEAIDRNKTKTLEKIKEIIRQPSIAATGHGIRECATLVSEMMQSAGASTRVLDLGDGASPLVYGEFRSNSNSEKTVLFFNHYDVQPPEPLELWETPPFEPQERDGKLFGRGANDDKADVVGRLGLVEAFMEAANDIPCNFKFAYEGEEEVGSAHLKGYMEKFPELFRADAVIWEGGSIDPKGRPEMLLGSKGIMYVELLAKNAKTDSHSSIAAIVENPAWRLVRALNTLKKEERITIPGWYDDVRPFTKKELDLIRKQPYDDSAIKNDLGIKQLIGGMKGFEVKKSLAGKPTCTICGLVSGYTGQGAKAVLPKEARAKIDFRLVPDQDPEDLIVKLRSHLRKQGFGDVEILFSEGEKAARTSPDSEIARAANEAAKDVYGTPPIVKVSAAGSGPMYLFKSPVAAIGGAGRFSRAHAPNENLDIHWFFMGLKWIANTINLYSNS